MEEAKQVSDIDILKNSVETLGRIQLPLELFNTAGAQILRVRNNLKVLLDALSNTEQMVPADKEVTEETELPEVSIEEINK